jgi:hypothetical protein
VTVCGVVPLLLAMNQTLFINAVGYAMHGSRSVDAVIRVF